MFLMFSWAITVQLGHNCLFKHDKENPWNLNVWNTYFVDLDLQEYLSSSSLAIGCGELFKFLQLFLRDCLTMIPQCTKKMIHGNITGLHLKEVLDL